MSMSPRVVMWYSFQLVALLILANDGQAGRLGGYEMSHCGEPLTAAQPFTSAE
jgi:hypothetical protein